MLYASEIATLALDIAPRGTAHSGADCHCCMCQRPIRAGDLSNQYTMPKTFMDFHEVSPSNQICGFCMAIVDQNVLRNLQRAVVTPDGVYSLNKDSHRAWFWATPPKPPYVVVINHSTLGAFHYVWRTPVTLDNRLVWFNLDGRVMQARRGDLSLALSHAKKITDLLNAGRKKSPINTPFLEVVRAGLSKGSSYLKHGAFREDALALGRENPSIAESLAFLRDLPPGDLMMLSPFLKDSPSEPEEPSLVKGIPLKDAEETNAEDFQAA